MLSNNCSIARHPCRAINNIHAKCLQTVKGQKTLDTPINSLTDTQQTLYKKVTAFLFFRYRIIKTFYRLPTWHFLLFLFTSFSFLFYFFFNSPLGETSRRLPLRDGQLAARYPFNWVVISILVRCSINLALYQTKVSFVKTRLMT